MSQLLDDIQYECVYLRDFETGSEARQEIGTWFTYYDEDRPHSALGDRTPAEAYHGHLAA